MNQRSRLRLRCFTGRRRTLESRCATCTFKMELWSPRPSASSSRASVTFWSNTKYGASLISWRIPLRLRRVSGATRRRLHSRRQPRHPRCPHRGRERSMEASGVASLGVGARSRGRSWAAAGRVVHLEGIIDFMAPGVTPSRGLLRRTRLVCARIRSTDGRVGPAPIAPGRRHPLRDVLGPAHDDRRCGEMHLDSVPSRAYANGSFSNNMDV